MTICLRFAQYLTHYTFKCCTHYFYFSNKLQFFSLCFTWLLWLILYNHIACLFVLLHCMLRLQYNNFCMMQSALCLYISCCFCLDESKPLISNKRTVHKTRCLFILYFAFCFLVLFFYSFIYPFIHIFSHIFLSILSNGNIFYTLYM